MKRFLSLTRPLSSRFFIVGENKIEALYLTAQQGELQRSRTQQTMSEEELQQTLTEGLEGGCVELSASDYEEAIKQAEHRLESLCVENAGAGARFVAWRDLDDSLKGYFQNDPEEYLTPPLQTFCVFDQPVELETLLLHFDELAPTAQTAQRNLIFTSGLTVRENLDAGSGTSALPLLVLVIGDLHVHNLILTSWAELVVTGNLTATGTVFGYDGETGGRLKVHGHLTAPRILSGAMYTIEIGGNLNAQPYHLDDDTASFPSSTAVPTELRPTDSPSPLCLENYYQDSSWATGEELRTLVFNSDQTISALRENREIFA